MSFLDQNVSWFAIATCGVAAFWFWTAMEGRLKGLGNPWRRLERRALATNFAFATLLGSLILHLTTDAGDFVLSGLAFAAVLVFHKVSDEVPSFWEHQRVRWWVAALLITSFLALHFLVPTPTLMTLLVAGYIFHRNLDAHFTIEKETLQDLHALQARLQRLEGQRDVALLTANSETHCHAEEAAS